MKKGFCLLIIVFFLVGFPITASALYITGGDAASQAAADDILDIVFVFDTSTSMNDEITAINTRIQQIVDDLDCPDCDVWVRATLMGITQDSVFGENVKDYVTAAGGTSVSNHIEDNGPAVTDMVNYYNWNDDSTATQDYYKAIVTIGDEGTEDGYPTNQADWAAAYTANQAAVDNDIMIFSVVGTPWPSYTWDQTNRDDVFRAMAIGGTGGGYSFDATGGTFVATTTNTIETDIENIICTAGGGGTVPEPGTMFLMGACILGLATASRRKLNNK